MSGLKDIRTSAGTPSLGVGEGDRRVWQHVAGGPEALPNPFPAGEAGGKSCLFS